MQSEKCSYYECLDYMGISNDYKRWSKRIYSEGKRRIYSTLKKLELTPNTIESLIKSYNERVLKLEKKLKDGALSMNYRLFEYSDIRDHFVITNILFDMERKTFNSEYNLYRDKDNKSSIYIGIDGVDNQKLNIPDSVVKIIDTGIFEDNCNMPEYPKFYSNRGAVRLNITEAGIKAANERIERGIQANWERTHSPACIKFLRNNKLG